MPRSKRPPIDYTPQFGGGIFRSRDVVESELAAAEERQAVPVTQPETEERPDASGRAVARSTRSRKGSERSNEPPNVRTNERTKIRHTFDIFQDQLLALAEIQAARFKQVGRKPKIGELAQEALDAYIDAVHERSNERTKRRSNGG
jgi:hypothetical protein